MKSVWREIHCKDNSSLASDYTIAYNQEIPSLTGKNDVLIQVKACALSIINEKLLKELFKSGHSQYAVGHEIAGIIRQIGADVDTLQKGDEVVGIIPLDYNISGCADFVVLNEYDIVRKPNGISFVDAAGCIGDALKVYTALHYLGRISSKDTVLVFNGASSFGSLAIQLALHWGAKVIATSSSPDERLYLSRIEPELALVIDTSSSRSTLKESCLKETGGMGIDIIIDSISDKDQEANNEINDNFRYNNSSTYEIISILSVGGRWVTSTSDLQLDPPNSRTLHLKCASVGFLFEHAWTLSSGQLGHYQHILMDVMEKVADGTIRPNIHHTVPFESIPEAISRLNETKVGKVVAVL
ncbi:hypothetical protein CHUAL_012043 [Chamberlinius hualienensis]